MKSTLVFLMAAAAIQAGCASSTPAADTKAEEAAIRALDSQWSDAANKKDLDASVGFYSTSGATLWPDAPASHGTAAIRAAWVEGGVRYVHVEQASASTTASSEGLSDQGRPK